METHNRGRWWRVLDGSVHVPSTISRLGQFELCLLVGSRSDHVILPMPLARAPTGQCDRCGSRQRSSVPNTPTACCAHRGRVAVVVPTAAGGGANSLFTLQVESRRVAVGVPTACCAQSRRVAVVVPTACCAHRAAEQARRCGGADSLLCTQVCRAGAPLWWCEQPEVVPTACVQYTTVLARRCGAQALIHGREQPERSQQPQSGARCGRVSPGESSVVS